VLALDENDYPGAVSPEDKPLFVAFYVATALWIRHNDFPSKGPNPQEVIEHANLILDNARLTKE
jgi:hypothetical protein